jgi:hypothetical protein
MILWIFTLYDPLNQEEHQRLKRLKKKKGGNGKKKSRLVNEMAMCLYKLVRFATQRGLGKL